MTSVKRPALTLDSSAEHHYIEKPQKAVIFLWG